MTVRKGDDTNAFDFSFLTVELDNPEDFLITKAEIKIGTIVKTIENPEFPLEISLSNEETIRLNECRNQCFMAVYDDVGRKYTCEGTLTFPASPKVV